MAAAAAAATSASVVAVGGPSDADGIEYLWNAAEMAIVEAKYTFDGQTDK